jgi:hypothetical protein
LGDEQEHHDRGQTLAAAPGPLGRTPEASELAGLPAERTRKPSATRSEGPLCRGTNQSGPKRCAGKVLALMRLQPAPFLAAFSVGIARKGPCVLRITAPSSKVRMIYGALL